MKPEFSLTSDSTKPEVKNCMAHWTFSGGGASLRFNDAADAFTTNRIVDEAYKAGLSDGRREVARAVIKTATEQSA